MKKFTIAFAVALSLSAAWTSIAYAESQRALCENSGTIGEKWAEARNDGMSLSVLASNIGAIKGLSEEDALRGKVMAALVYSELKNLSPAQTRQYFYRECMKANK